MSWSLRRRFVILAILSVVVFSALSLVVISIVYEVPTCSDGIMNQDERGIDCGGVCVNICPFDAKPPSVLFARPVSTVPGRVDVIALVENPNAEAYAPRASYTIELFDSNQILIQSVSGVVALPPRGTIPIFIPNIISGERMVARAFLLFDTPVLYERRPDSLAKLPEVNRFVLDLDRPEPRITAEVENTETRDITNATFIVTLFNDQGTAFAAGRALVGRIRAQETATAVFTWPTRLPEAPARVEIIPVLPNPS